MPTIDMTATGKNITRMLKAANLWICNPAGYLQMEKWHRNANDR